jgi:hypothetical protein
VIKETGVNIYASFVVPVNIPPCVPGCGGCTDVNGFYFNRLYQGRENNYVQCMSSLSGHYPDYSHLKQLIRENKCNISGF